jgi:phosphotransferase system  glucose/maltose/N-acetylglucosamine-specific IIC component
MNYLNITKYVYLVVGFIMIYDAISRWNEEPKPWLSVVLAALAIFMYFFRRNFAKRFEDRKNQQRQNKPNE